jgi:hypothetical protein
MDLRAIEASADKLQLLSPVDRFGSLRFERAYLNRALELLRLFSLRSRATLFLLTIPDERKADALGLTFWKEHSPSCEDELADGTRGFKDEWWVSECLTEIGVEIRPIGKGGAGVRF